MRALRNGRFYKNHKTQFNLEFKTTKYIGKNNFYNLKAKHAYKIKIKDNKEENLHSFDTPDLYLLKLQIVGTPPLGDLPIF